jgi:endonuclease/exonuclease/phosphatase (EEP) superfamily protein YafD
LLEHLCILPGKVLIIGDFNIHWDDQNNAECKHFMDILDSFDLVQHVDFATHIGGHTLDFIISRSGDNIIDAVSPGDMIADHSAVLASLNMHKPKSKTKIVKY